MNDFIKEGIKVGDRLYSNVGGWGQIIEIKGTAGLCIDIQYDNPNEYDKYTRNGQYWEHDNAPQSLFWDEPKFEIPTKPKREVVKEFDVFVNYHPNFERYTEAFVDKTEADDSLAKALKYQRIKGKLTFTILE